MLGKIACLALTLNIMGTRGFLLSAPTARLGARRALSSLRCSDGAEFAEQGWWDAPKRIVETDGGLRARGLKYWLMDDHGVDLSKVDLRVSPLEGLGVFASPVPPPPHPPHPIPTPTQAPATGVRALARPFGRS